MSEIRQNNPASLRLVREQSKGDMRLDWNPGGLGCEIVLPLTSSRTQRAFELRETAPALRHESLRQRIS
jgi:hypothetical protein